MQPVAGGGYVALARQIRKGMARHGVLKHYHRKPTDEVEAHEVACKLQESLHAEIDDEDVTGGGRYLNGRERVARRGRSSLHAAARNACAAVRYQ